MDRAALPGRGASGKNDWMAKRLTIGLLTTGFADGLERAVFSGVAEAAEACDVNLTVIAGGRLQSPHGYEARANVLFDLVSREKIDGFVIRAGALGIFSGLRFMQDFCVRFGIPVVTTGASVPGLPHVLLDSYGPMYAEVTHLIEAHRLEKIAFVGGPATHQEARERYRAYVDALAQHKIELDPALVFEGSFVRESGEAAVERIFGRGPSDVQAIVGANDETAIGAMSALEKRSIDVPGRVAVVGFDDIEPSASTTPPLTTVHMDLGDAGRRAAELLVLLLNGKKIPETSVLTMPVVVRRSCGCFPIGSDLGASNGPVSAALDVLPHEDGLEKEIKRWMAERHGPDSGRSAGDWAARLVAAFRTDLYDQFSVRFATAWDEVLRRYPKVSVADLRDLAAMFHREAFPLAAKDPSLWRRAQELSEQAIILAGESARQREAREGWQYREQALRLRNLSETLVATFDLDKVMDLLAEELPRLGIRRCFVALYDGDGAPAEWSRLRLAYDENGRVPIEKGGRRFRSAELVPADLLPPDRCTLAVYALYFQDEQQGFIVFDVAGPEQGVVCSAVRGQVSTVIRGALLVRQLEARARELERAHKVQKEQQTKLIVSEKMASLGRLTAGIAHELNTPLAAVRAALSETDALVQEYGRSILRPEVDQEDHRQIAEEMGQAVALGSRAAEHAAAFVSGIKAQTRDLAPHPAGRCDAVGAVREALLLLGYAIREGKCEAIFEPSAESIYIHGSSGSLVRVVSNLVTNAIEALSSCGGGRIGVTLCDEGHSVRLEVSDAGAGIAPDVMPRIFDPMFSTKPFGQAMGLGLTIVHDLVKGEFGGTIEVESTEKVGTTVRIRLPKTETPLTSLRPRSQ
jgi:DNA-binding LacI/PurR family transcriptional regulator/signal transduction histidine kinase